MGRPSGYSEELTDAICEEIASGKSLNSICKRQEMPTMSMVFRWLEKNAAFRDKYARAREIQADVLFEQTLEIADSQEGDVIETDDGRTIVNHDVIARAKLRVDTRKWMAGKLRPKKYGDKLEIGGDAENPVNIVHRIERTIVDTKG